MMKYWPRGIDGVMIAGLNLQHCFYSASLPNPTWLSTVNLETTFHYSFKAIGSYFLNPMTQKNVFMKGYVKIKYDMISPPWLNFDVYLPACITNF